MAGVAETERVRKSGWELRVGGLQTVEHLSLFFLSIAVL